MTEIKGVHPYADIWPMMHKDELEELAESIKNNGLRIPIVLTPGGLILDGRNRYKACEIANVTPKITIYKGKDLVEFVIDANAERRHMSSGAKAMAKAKNLVTANPACRSGGRWARESVVHESARRGEQKAMTQAGVVLDYATDLQEYDANTFTDVVNQIIVGAMPLNKAYEAALVIKKNREEKQKKAKQNKERIDTLFNEMADAGRQDLLDLISDGKLTVEQAYAVYEKDTEQERKIAKEKLEARSQLYTGIAEALQTLHSFGGYPDTKHMEEYSSQELSDPELFAPFFEVDNLIIVKTYIERLIEWRKNVND